MTTAPTTTAQLSHLLRHHGRKVTAQRLAVYRAITGLGQHVTAEQVYDQVRCELPRISLTTVYNSLHELVELGQLSLVDLGDGTTRFDPNRLPHAHLVCRQCHRAEDLPTTDYVVGLPPVSARGFSELRHSLVFVGRCPTCQSHQTG